MVTDVVTLNEQIDQTLLQERLISTLSIIFGVLALLLACIGLYGIMSSDVVRRTNEIGIRMALGARGGDVLQLVMRETLLLVGIGIVIGLGVALAVSRFISSLLYGLTPTDPLTMLLASLILISVAIIAGFMPARRASKVDPLVALRHE